jgi:hypothetical protein
MIPAIGIVHADNSLVASWEFRRDPSAPGIVRDTSGNNFNLKIEGDGSRARFETVDSFETLSLNGSHSYESNAQFRIHVKIPFTTFDPANGFTFTAWIIPGAGYDRKNIHEIFSNAIAMSENGPGFRLNMFYAETRFYSGNGEKEKSKTLTWGAQSSGLENWRKGKWYHIAAVYNGSCFKIYIDGLKVAESKSGLTIPQGSEEYNIGSFSEGHCYGFNGSIAFAELYSGALSEQELLLAAQSKTAHPLKK